MVHRRLPLLAACATALLFGPAAAQTYAIDFVATASNGAAMDAAGHIVAGTTTLPPACAGCPPTFGVPAVWNGGQRTLLAVPPGFDFLSFAGITAEGTLVGNAHSSDLTRSRALRWTPLPGGGFAVTELGTLPGLTDATAIGVDAHGRVFGTAFTWQGGRDPFVWTAAGGIASLTAQGYPGDPPAAVSPAGTIGTATLNYRYGDPSSVVALAPPPTGYLAPGLAWTIGNRSINDDGVRALLLGTTSGEHLGTLFRYRPAAGWQPLSGLFASDAAPAGIGSIDAEGTITATLQATGLRAAGPAGTAVGLTSLLSPAYGDSSVLSGGAQGDDGSILASVVVGRSPRLARLVPTAACTDGCTKVATLVLSGRMVSERGKPGQCTPLASNRVTAQLTVTDEHGVPLRDATVQGRFLDDYTLDQPVSLRTNRQGQATAQHSGPACVGAVAFLVEAVSAGTRRLDRSTGVLSGWVIPLPRPK